jgi:N-acetylmuramoyl-L-alanine amidase
MESSPSQTNEQYKRKSMGAFQQIQVVVGVAFLLATLFTAWTPAGLLPDSLAEKLTGIIVPPEEETLNLAPTPTARPNLRIGIVAGHWGSDPYDPGAVCGDGLKEVDINLDIASRVRESLIGQGFDVDLLKEFDPRLNGYRGLLLVSIHADSCEYVNDEATGFKVAAAMSTVYPEKAARLTACLRSRYSVSTGLDFHPGSVTADMTSYHGFDEVHGDTTAAIIETGFMNLDRQILTQQPDLVAQGIIQGVLCFVNNEDISGPPTPIP